MKDAHTVRVVPSVGEEAARTECLNRYAEHLESDRLETISFREARTNMLHVIIVDEDPQFRQEIRAVLELWEECIVVGESTHPTEVIEMAHLHPHTIVLLNGDLPASAALDIVWLLRSSVATVGIIILTQVPDEERLFQFLKGGANAYKTHTISPEVLIETIRRVSSGEYLFSDGQAGREPFVSSMQRD